MRAASVCATIGLLLGYPVGAVRAAEKADLQVTRVAMALAAYRAEHDAFPPKLAKLAPKHLAKVPGDRFSDTELTYRRTDDGYVLYSVGPNGQDDNGRNWQLDPKPADAEYDRHDWDDIAIRVPAP